MYLLISLQFKIQKILAFKTFSYIEIMEYMDCVKLSVDCTDIQQQ